MAVTGVVTMPARPRHAVPSRMDFSEPLIPGTLLRRYKRFLADVELDDGTTITAHTPNTGSMLGCAEPGFRVWLRDTANPKRKYRYAWEMVEVDGGALVGIDTGLPNKLVAEAVEQGVIAELQGYETIRPEVRYGRENSRADLLLEGEAGRCFVEVKNVTAAVGDGVAVFPDAVSARGTKHLRELMDVVAQGDRAVMCFCVQREDVAEVRPADAIDPLYGATLREALAAGVEAIAYGAEVSPRGVRLARRLAVVCPDGAGTVV